ncbi:Uncharacterised protein [uncultured archaeon]|nr:Uncharacterised protein [uncultured archaeon]
MVAGALLRDNRVIFSLRLALLVLVPFLLGAFIFPHTQYVNGSLLSTPNQYRNATDVLSYSFSSSGASFINRGIGNVFPLASYLDFPPLVSRSQMELCFQDNGSSITLPNGTEIAPDVQWSIHVNNNPPIRINTTTFACTDVPSTGPVVYAWTASVNTGVAPDSVNGTIIFNPATLTYPRMEVNYGLLQGLVMIPVFYLIIWYPLAGIWKKLRGGMLEQ